MHEIDWDLLAYILVTFLVVVCVLGVLYFLLIKRPKTPRR